MYLRRVVRVASSPVEVTRYRSLSFARPVDSYTQKSHTTGFPRKKVIEAFHRKGLLVGSVAGKVEHAVRAVEAGVDFVIAQGSEGGGHTGTIASSVLIPSVVDAVRGRVPVVAAGGIYDGRGLAASMMYGAAGVWVGTCGFNSIVSYNTTSE